MQPPPCSALWHWQHHQAALLRPASALLIILTPAHCWPYPSCSSLIQRSHQQVSWPSDQTPGCRLVLNMTANNICTAGGKQGLTLSWHSQLAENLERGPLEPYCAQGHGTACCQQELCMAGAAPSCPSGASGEGLWVFTQYSSLGKVWWKMPQVRPASHLNTAQTCPAYFPPMWKVPSVGG